MHPVVPEDRWDLFENSSSQMSREIGQRNKKLAMNFPLHRDLHPC